LVRVTVVAVVEMVGLCDGLFLAFNHKLYIAGKLTRRGQDRIDREQAGDDMSLVITYAAAVEFPVSQGRLEGRRLPQLQRLGRLDIIMVIDQKCPVGFAFSLSIDDRRATGIHDLDVKAAGLKHLRNQGSTLAHAKVLSPYTGLGNQLRKLGDALIQVCF
jgi:hypothetical protein